jgi:hypothetical protein
MTIEAVGIIAGLVVLVVGVVIYFFRQRGGDGPPVGEVARTFRPWVNAWYGLNRWPIPFDRDGSLIPVDQRKRATDS